MTFEIKPATRTAVKPLICLFSESGCGKTYSALLTARGFVGPEGKIVLADTESGRGSLYADVIPGGYSVIDIKPPFAPHVAIEVMDAVHKSGAGIGILDSGSHFWEGIGGVLEMATENESKSGKPGLHNWRIPKLEHAKFVLALLQAPIPWIVCLRAKYKTRQGKENGKTVIIKDDYTSPIQAEDFIFEATLHGEVMPDHSFRLTKQSHPTLGACFPAEGQMITVETGKKLAEWCASAGTPAKPKQHSQTVASLKNALWKLTMPLHNGDANKLQQFLHDENLMELDAKLADLGAEQLMTLLEKTTDHLKGAMAK